MPIPLVVIVGRPNVGKSTLFNRLTKSKNSIVDDQSGVTRDRIYGEVEWNGRAFKLMDTGGYVKESDDKFEMAIKEQVEIAIEEADALLFITDGRAGITTLDSEMAALLRKTKKTTFVLVNKADTTKFENDKLEFYSFGLENVFDISALNGRNVGDLLDDLINELKFPDENLPEDPRLKIIRMPLSPLGNIRNNALKYVKKPWVAYCDGDDIWCSEMLTINPQTFYKL